MGVDWMFFPAEFKNGEWDAIELDNAELAFKARRLAAHRGDARRGALPPRTLRGGAGGAGPATDAMHRRSAGRSRGGVVRRGGGGGVRGVRVRGRSRTEDEVG